MKKVTLSLMRIFLVLVLFSLPPFGNFSIAKQIHHDVKISMGEATVKKVTDAITNQTGIVFSYDFLLGNTQIGRVDLNLRNASTEEIMDAAFSKAGISYKIKGNMVALFQREAGKKSEATSPQARESEKTVRITGSVKDATDGSPLIGVNVIPRNSMNKGTASDINGNYIIDVPRGAEIEFSYLGYNSIRIKAGESSSVDIFLQPDTEILEQAAVVGYGTQKRISLIGATQSISAPEIKVPVANLTQSLAGRISGVVSMQRTGEPGYDDASIYIRGISPLTAGMSAPLTLVDGVPRSISNVDPEDIESFSILKDASATAIYGVRGANGVIIINTKSGSAGKPQFDIRYTEGITRFIQLPDFVDAPEYMRLTNEAFTTRREEPMYTDEAISKTESGEDPYLYPNVDWMDLLFKKFGHNRSANANIRGGSDKAIYYIGLGYFEEQGLYNNDSASHDYNANTYYRRYSVTSNMTLKPFVTTEIKLGIQGYLANANYPASSNSAIFGSAFYATPNYVAPVYPNGEIGDRPSGSVQNPYAVLNEMGYANQWRSQVFSNLRLTQQIPFVPGLSVTGMFSFDAYSYSSNRFTRTPNTWMALGRDDEGKLILQQTRSSTTTTLSYANSHQGNRNIYLEAAANYKQTFGKHDVTGMLLFNQSDEMNTLATSLETALPYRFRGLAGRYTYAYSERYFAEFNFGYNGSENFNPDKRYGFFPSFGLGWVISNERFFEPLKNAVQFMKIRATWGKVGNAKITGRRFAYLSTVDSVTGYTFGDSQKVSYSGLAIGDEGVDVSWETARKYNLGIDIITLGNNLNIQVDVFKDKRDGIFLSRQVIPAYLGIRKSPLGNIGKVNNKGFEISLDYHNQVSQDWFISAMGNFSFNRNKVVENDMTYTYPWQDRRGHRVGQRFGLIAEKLFESDEEVAASAYQASNTRAGDIKFKDLNGDGQINDYDMAPIGWGTVPEIIYGFGLNIAFRNIAISAMLQGAAHVDALVSGVGVAPFESGTAYGNIMSNITDRWTEDNPNPNAFYPRLAPSSTYNLNYKANSWFVLPSHYLRLKNCQMTYSLPKTFVRRIGLSSASVFFQGVNILTFTPFKLWDVEQGDGRGSVYPNTASYSLGLNFSF